MPIGRPECRSEVRLRARANARVRVRVRVYGFYRMGILLSPSLDFHGFPLENGYGLGQTPYSKSVAWPPLAYRRLAALKIKSGSPTRTP